MSHKYEEVKKFRDPDGVILVITRKAGSGHFTFRIQKEYETQGVVKHTSYLGRRHIPAIKRLLKQAEDELDIRSDGAVRKHEAVWNG